MEQYLIIGNGIAAAGCIEGIRSVDQTTPIVLVSGEDRAVYCRPLISYYLQGRTTIEKMNYRCPDFYADNKVQVIYGQTVTSLGDKEAVVSDGSKIAYSKACIATGSSPFVPPMSGLDLVKDKYCFMTVDDTLALESAIRDDSRVLIVGAGLIGLKCAEGLSGRVASISVCDLAPRVLSSILDDECADYMQQRLEDNGIALYLGDSAASFEAGEEGSYLAVMNSGARIPFDILVLAVGVRPNTSLVSDAGGKVERGIMTDDHMATSLADIYAAGDCTVSHDISCGKDRILAIWPNAYIQGYTAGCNMAGKEEVFTKSMPMNSIGFFGLHAMTAGSYFTEEEGGTLYEEKGEGSLKRLFTKDGKLTGYIMIGDVAKAGIYTSLIRDQRELSEIDFEMIRKSPTLAAFAGEERERRLGGVV